MSDGASPFSLPLSFTFRSILPINHQTIIMSDPADVTKDTQETSPSSVPDISEPRSTDESSAPVDLTAGGEDGKGTITLRALISTKEAGIIIGKAGETVAKLRDSTKVKAGVSKVVSGVQDRVLSITGSVDQISDVSPFSVSSKPLI